MPRGGNGLRFNVALKGVPQMKAAIRTYDDATNVRLRTAVRTSTENVLARAKSRVRVRSAAGQKALRSRYNKAGTIGTITHSRKTFYLRLIEFGTKHHKAFPFLFPSIEEEKDAHIERIKAAINGAAEQAGS